MGMPSLKNKDIKDNFLRTKERMALAARKAGREPESIRLVVVTKTHPIEVIHTVIDAGATDLGENYVEEAIPKIQGVQKDTAINWHMIGHIQSRKALQVCESFQFIHSLDSVKLAARLCRFASELGKTIPAFLEFNVSGEVSKSGFNILKDEDWTYILPEIEKIIALPNLNILGLMTIPLYSTDAEASRPYYRRLRVFQEYIIEHLHLPPLRELSIGMSADFEVAIQEGSTCVRIGQAILGPRAA